jgi:hypothetical protein
MVAVGSQGMELLEEKYFLLGMLRLEHCHGRRWYTYDLEPCAYLIK